MKLKDFIKIWKDEELKAIPEWSPDKTSRLKIRLAADDRSQAQERIAALQDRIGDELDRARIDFTEDVYGELAIESETSLWLILRRDDNPASEFDGCEIEFYVQSSGKIATETIEDGVALIDFGKLSIPIENYRRIRFRIKTISGEIEAHIGEE